MLQHSDQYEDNIHFNPSGANIQGQQAAHQIRSLLKR
jgi:hypothetical protein